MNKTFKQRALPLLTTLVLGAMAMDASAQMGYWEDQSGAMVRSGTGECVRTGHWTPELATAKCDPDLMPKTLAAAPADVSAKTRRVVPAAMPVTEKVSMDADALFDFDKSVIKPKGEEALDEMVRRLNLRGADLGLIVPTGHTDSIGDAEYNMDLSTRRAEAVKTYLIGKGIDGDLISTVGKGERRPVSDNATAKGRTENRHVVIEVTRRMTPLKPCTKTQGLFYGAPGMARSALMGDVPIRKVTIG